MEHAYQWHKKTKSSKFIVWSQSLGGAISIPVVASSKLKEKVDLIIIESSFPSYQDIAFDKLTLSWITTPLSPLAYLLVSDAYASEKYLEKLAPTPMLVVHSKADQVVPYKFGEDIFYNYHGPKEFWTYQGKRHIGVFPHKEERKKLTKYFDNLEER